ncbi:MerR family DNA-binding transcriptional regulator [Streptomyces atratus]|uniref:MerR family DNA-binding transcriptional regulator n=1 Tax=Streptomyces atratus TaxID=1893 RepID=UPI0022518620|nr:MerR family DNA-binding transcriptional regulator [Streptomyces atratus]MCX5345082.1 MerR family DNA-binding transcriptional regulator [Streptomyces atratus]
MRIGDLAARTGLTTKTIRFYEGSGLLPAPPRTPGGYRDTQATQRPGSRSSATPNAPASPSPRSARSSPCATTATLRAPTSPALSTSTWTTSTGA